MLKKESGHPGALTPKKVLSGFMDLPVLPHRPFLLSGHDTPSPFPLPLLFLSIMASEMNHCKNHPETEAVRRCYQCLDSICPDCQRRAIGHIFCSWKCQARCWVSQRATLAGRLFLRLGLRLRRVEKTISRVTGSGTMRIVTIALLVMVLTQVMSLVRELGQVDMGLSVEEEIPVPPSVQIIPGDDYLTVAGSAPGFAVAVLSADGMEVDTCTVKEGYFSFTFKPGKEVRSVQVQVFGDRVPTLFSRSYPVPDVMIARQEEQSPKPVTAEKEPEPAPEPLPARESEQDEKPARAAAGPLTEPGPEPRVEQEVAGSAPVPEPQEVAAKVPDIKKKKTALLSGIDNADLLADMSRGSNDSRQVAITFDGGSFDGSTSRILKVLKERNIKATFFLTGEFMKRFPQATRDVVSMGHEVGNHTYSHLHLTTYEKDRKQETIPGITRELLQDELKRNEELFRKITGREMIKLWRAPYGEHNAKIRRWAAEADYKHISWTVDRKTRQSLDALDWVADTDSTLYLSSGEIVRKLLAFDTATESGMGGGIMLMHLGSERTDQLHAKLGQLIDLIQERGYKLSTVSELIEEGEGS
jgi:peptidoglycan/xylan/chitin deacetylase (PgdA/CDA1 family)